MPWPRMLQCVSLSVQRNATLKLLGRAGRANATIQARYGSSTPPQPSALGYTDYEHERKTFKLERPEFYNFATDCIDAWAEKEKKLIRDPNIPAFWWTDGEGTEIKWSFTELAENSKKAANVLAGPCGIKANDRVIVILPRVPQFWLLNLAAMRIGAVVIPGTTQLTARDIRHRLQKSRATCIVADQKTAEKVEEVMDECPDLKTKLFVREPGYHQGDRLGWLDFNNLYDMVSSDLQNVKTRIKDPMQIFFTSGTTGAPKMVEHSHGSYGLAHQLSGRYWLDGTPSDIVWSMSDTGWAKCAWTNLFITWNMGSCVFINRKDFDPMTIRKTVENFPISIFCVAPTGYRMLINEPDFRDADYSRVRHCITAGEPLNPEVSHAWRDMTGHVVREGYGQTETVLLAASSRFIPNKAGSMGKPPPGMDTRIVDDDGQECPVGVEGNIALKVTPERPIGMFNGYVDDPVKTADRFVGEFFLTGDHAVQDEDGYLWFTARADDVITSSGYRIGPFEIESALIEHPAVFESAAVASPDPVRGEVVKAFVVLTQAYKDADEDKLRAELQNHVKHTTAPYKYPRKMEFVNELPKTVSGKIRRVELKEREFGHK